MMSDVGKKRGSKESMDLEVVEITSLLPSTNTKRAKKTTTRSSWRTIKYSTDLFISNDIVLMDPLFLGRGEEVLAQPATKGNKCVIVYACVCVCVRVRRCMYVCLDPQQGCPIEFKGEAVELNLTCQPLHQTRKKRTLLLDCCNKHAHAGVASRQKITKNSI